jgi:hypothetical protein
MMNPKTAIPVAERGTRFVIAVFGMKEIARLRERPDQR